MASQKSYKITIKNNRTERQGITFLQQTSKKFILPTLANRKQILDLLELDRRYLRAFDLIIVKGHDNTEPEFVIDDISKIELVELKTTQKELPNLPYGFFFGATDNEFQIASKLGGQYKFCFLSLHPKSPNYCLLTLEEMKPLIKNKRVQYQINFKTEPEIGRKEK